MAAPKVEQAFVAQDPHRPQDGVAIDAENRSKIASGWQPLAWLRLPVRNCPPDLGRHLVVELHGVVAIDLAIQHGAMHTSFTNAGHARARAHPPPSLAGRRGA